MRRCCPQQGICILAALLSFTLFLLPLRAPSAVAGTLLSVALTVDGSIEPPGDLLQCTVVAEPADVDVFIEVRAYVVTGPENEQVEPVISGVAASRDDQGHFVLRHRVATDEDGGGAIERVVVPYAALELAKGQHQLGYEVALHVGRQRVGVQGTPLTRVTITDEARTENKRRKVVAGEQVVEQQATARFGSGDPRTGQLRVEQRQIPVAARQEASAAMIESVPARIPGGYLREAATTGAADGAPIGAELHGLTDKAWLPASTVLPSEERAVYFATNRGVADDGSGPNFGNDRAENMSFGSCIVNFPVLHHRRGELELPQWWQPRDPSQHFLIQTLSQFSRAEFQAAVGAGDVLVYVHGFKTTFELAVLRTAQLQYDLEFPGNALAFSWPSAGSVTKYQEDAAEVDAAAVKLAEVLSMLIEPDGEADASGQPQRRVHIIAHSLGNRILLNAVFLLQRDGGVPADRKSFGQVVLAAPDVGAIMFNNLLPHVVQSAERVTYYYCNLDMALVASRQTNLYEPVGLLPFFQQGIDTINADGTDTTFLSHGYYASSPKVLRDIQLLVKQDRGPSQRMPPIVSHSLVYGHDHWSFSPQPEAGSAAAAAESNE